MGENVQVENVELENNPEVSLFVNCIIVWLVVFGMESGSGWKNRR